MAKTIILAALIFVSISGYTQLVQQDSTIAKATPVDYLKMSKKQKTGGFILLTTSVVSGIAGLGILAKEGGNLFNDGRNTGACILGGCSNTPEESYNDGKARGGLATWWWSCNKAHAGRYIYTFFVKFYCLLNLRKR